MRVKIYQINPERDNNRMKFMSLSDSQSPDPSIYDEVFDAEIDENELEEIYGRFNTVGHPLFRGHSLSVSDVVVANGKASICQSIGFRDVSFDTTKTHKPDNLMRVVYVELNKAPYVAEVAHTLEAEQKAVGGYIEVVYPDDNETCIICNEESNAVIIECNMEHGSFQNCCTDGTNFYGLNDYAEINMRGCNSDREDWRRDGFDPELIM
mgnify:CR=1 FL=1